MPESLTSSMTGHEHQEKYFLTLSKSFSGRILIDVQSSNFLRLLQIKFNFMKIFKFVCLQILSVGCRHGALLPWRLMESRHLPALLHLRRHAQMPCFLPF